MPHSIHVGFLGVNDLAQRQIDAVIARGILSAKNIFISDTDAGRREQYVQQGVTAYKDNISTLMKAEIVVIAASKREFGTVLAPICALTRGKIILVMTAGIDCTYVLERVTRGTLVVSAAPTQTEAGIWQAHPTYSEGFPEYLKAACADIIGTVCEMLA